MDSIGIDEISFRPASSDALADPPVDQLSEIVMQAVEETSMLIESVLSYHTSNKSYKRLSSEAEGSSSKLQTLSSTSASVIQDIKFRVRTLHLASTLSLIDDYSGQKSFEKISNVYG